MKKCSIQMICCLIASLFIQVTSPLANTPATISSSHKIAAAGTDYIFVHLKGYNAGQVEFTGFRPSLEEWCPQLPFNNRGLMVPDNYCGLRIRYVSSAEWHDASGKRIGSKKNIANINGSQYHLDGINFTGYLETCGDPSGWKFPYPLSSNGKAPANAATLVLEVEYPQNTIYHPAIEFLNSSGGLMKLFDLFDRDVPKEKEWLDQICGKYPKDYCDKPEPVGPDMSDHPFRSNHAIHRRARQIDSRPLTFPMYLIPESEIQKTGDGKYEYQAFKFLGDGGKLPGVSGNKLRIYSPNGSKRANEIYGKILTYWKGRDYEKGSLGYPRTRIKNSANGGFYCVFENNVVHAHPTGKADIARHVDQLRDETDKLKIDLVSSNKRKKMAAMTKLHNLSKKVWYADAPLEEYIDTLKGTIKKKILDGNENSSVQMEFKDVSFKKLHKWKKSNGQKPRTYSRVMEFRVKVKPINIPVTTKFSIYVRVYQRKKALYAQVINYNNLHVDYGSLRVAVVLAELGLGSPRGMKKLIWSKIKDRMENGQKTFKMADMDELLDNQSAEVSVVATHPQSDGDVHVYFFIKKVM